MIQFCKIRHTVNLSHPQNSASKKAFLQKSDKHFFKVEPKLGYLINLDKRHMSPWKDNLIMSSVVNGISQFTKKLFISN